MGYRLWNLEYAYSHYLERNHHIYIYMCMLYICISAGPCLPGATRLRSKAFQHSILSSFQYSISRWGICYLMSCRSAIWYCYWFTVPPGPTIYLPPGVVSQLGVVLVRPWNSLKFKAISNTLKIIKLVPQDVQKCPKWGPNRTWNHQIHEKIKKCKSNENTIIYCTFDRLGHHKSADVPFKNRWKSYL